MPLFYTPQLKKNSSSIIIEGEEYNHIVNARRKVSGAEIKITNGKGLQASGKIIDISQQKLKLRINRIEEKKKSKPRIALAFSLLKNKNKLIIEKCTELGIWEFFPYVSERTVKKNYSEKLRSKLQRVSTSAMKQSDSVFLPAVNSTCDYIELISNLPRKYMTILAWEDSETQFIDEVLESSQKDFCLIIGPEGGFTRPEIAFAKKNSINIVSLGNHILRAETAALATAAYSIFFQVKNNNSYY